MEELVARVKDLLSTDISGPDTQVELDETVPGQKIGGTIIASRFRGLRQIERQEIVWQILEENLPSKDLLSVGLLLTLTPQEVAAMEDVAVAA